MKKKRPSFNELVMENKLELMKDKKAIDRIEMKIERKYEKELVGSYK